MKTRTLPVTKERLRDLFDYREDGVLVRRYGRWSGLVAGDRPEEGQYSRFRVDRNRLGAHQFIFIWHHGYLPVSIDHINGDIHDNRIENLRPADYQLNAFNRLRPAGSCDLPKHVRRNRGGTFRVTIEIDGVVWKAGPFKNVEDADRAAHELRAMLHGAFSVDRRPSRSDEVVAA